MTNVSILLGSRVEKGARSLWKLARKHRGAVLGQSSGSSEPLKGRAVP